MNEITNEIEIALRDGLIDELTESTAKGLELISKLTNLVQQQEASIKHWERLNLDLVTVAKQAIDERDTARALAVRLEQECHQCTDTVHHGNEDQY